MKKLCIAALALVCGLVPARAQLITSTTSISEQTIEKREKKPSSVMVRYQGELNFGYATGGKLKWENGGKTKTDFSRPFIETVHGVRITDYAFAGVGFGIQYAYGDINKDSEDSDSWDALMIPIFLNLKGSYPVTKDFAPYISLSFGGSICATSSFDDSGEDYGYWETKLKGGYYGEYGVGFTYKKFNFGLGLQHYALKLCDTYEGTTEESKAKINSFYVKLGFKF